MTRVSVDSNSNLSSFKNTFFSDYFLNIFFRRIREKKKLIVQAHREMKPRNNRAKLPRSTFLKVGFFHGQFFQAFYCTLIYGLSLLFDAFSLKKTLTRQDFC